MDQLTQEQIKKLQQLGINPTQDNNLPPKINLKNNKKIKKAFPIFPLLSISGLTILSFSGLVLLKNNNQDKISLPQENNLPENTLPTPTQVPKSIQHYLLTSQQYFTQAIQQQNSPKQEETVNLLNQSILATTQAIKEFPNDYRGFLQRGRIYQSLLTSQPQLGNQALSDLTQAQKLNPNSAEITRNLASLYAFKGDAQNTIQYLQQTVILEPTKAQNFYDLAKIQQQVGLIPQALETYNKLISLVTDPNQKVQIKNELTSLQEIISQNPNIEDNLPQNSKISPLPLNLDSPTIQALAENNIIIASPEEINKVEINNITDSNSLSGEAILSRGNKNITLQNSNLSSDSQVYVTILKGGKNQNLQVVSKTDNSFIVGLSSPITEDIEFKWWIIK